MQNRTSISSIKTACTSVRFGEYLRREHIIIFVSIIVLCSVGMHMPSELEEMKNRMKSSQLETYNLTNNDLVKDHLRYLVSTFFCS